MKGIREMYTAEQLYEQLRPRLSLSDAWMAQQHPDLLRAADAMVDALQKKESYGGGVAQRAAHLAAHLKAIDPALARWLERQQALEGAKAAREAAAAATVAAAQPPAPAAVDTPCPDSSGAAAAAAATTISTSTTTSPPLLPGSQGNGRMAIAATAVVMTTSAPLGGEATAVSAAAAGAGAGGAAVVLADSDVSPGSPIKGPSSSSKGGAATALEYLTTTFAHLREQRTLVMGDKKDRLLKEVAGLRQMRAGTINVLRGAKASGTTMADMLAALKAADANPDSILACTATAATEVAAPPPPAAAAVPAAAHADEMGAPAVPAGSSSSFGGSADLGCGGCVGGDGGGQHQTVAPSSTGYLDNLTCVVWEDWRIPERLDKLLWAGDTVCVFVEVHCRDGPEDTRLAMRLNTFVALALCNQRLIAELYQDMFIVPQRTAAARPQRKRQRTAAEETVQTLDESPDSLDFVDFVEALHRRMPLRCGWMYANAILPNAGEWDRVFGRQAGRLSGLYEGGPELDALGRACLAFHHTRHESPVLDVHVLASQLRQQQQQQLDLRVPTGWPRNAVELATATTVPKEVAVAAAALTHGSACCAAAATVEAAPPPPPSLILRAPYDRSGRGQGLDLGHLSFTCVASAPLSDDFLGELIRQTTAGQAAAEVAAAAAAAAALRASRCVASGRVGCTGTCVEDAAAAAAAAEKAAAAAADYMSWGAVEGDDEDDEERELCDAVNEELQAVEEAAVEAEREVEVEMEMMEVQKLVKKEEEAESAVAAAAAVLGSGRGATAVAGGLHLKGAFSHRMQLMPGVFFSYYIGSQAFTNTAWHVEDFLLQSINMMLVGRPKAWWWVPRDKEAAFKEYLEDQWDAEDVYTKSVPLAAIPLDKLIKMGIKRSVQLPGAVFITSPGYAFHTTMSAGWSMADSANFMANVVGKDMHVLEDERPLEQYPPTEGRTNTGEWVRFTMRRIEELRARNDPTYQPRPLRRIREQVQARRAAVAAAAAATASGVKRERRDGTAEEEEEDKMLTAAPSHGARRVHGHGHLPKAAKVKVEEGAGGGGGGSVVGTQQQQQEQQQQQQQQQQKKSRQRNDKALLQAYVQAKETQKAEVNAAAQAAAQRRQARIAARQQQHHPQPGVPAAARKSSGKSSGGAPKAKPVPQSSVHAPLPLPPLLPNPQQQSRQLQSAAAPLPAAETPMEQLQQQVAMQFQPLFFMPEQPAEVGHIDVQPQNFSEQELLAGLLPGVLRGLLPEATAMLQQQKQQQQQQRLEVEVELGDLEGADLFLHPAAPHPQPQPQPQPLMGRRVLMQGGQQQPHQQQLLQSVAAVAVSGVADEVMEEAAATGSAVAAREVPWRVAVA